jgi:hypothetical protein
MKFPDDSSLLKHMSLKKGCLDTYNMGLMDPSITLEDQPGKGENKDAILSSVAFYSSEGVNKRKKLNISDDVDRPVQGNIVINSFATYAFRQHYSKTQFSSMNNFAHGYTSKFPPSSESMRSPGPSTNNYDKADVEYEYGQDVDFLVDYQSNSSDASSVGSDVDGEYNEVMDELDDQSADEVDGEFDVTDARDSLKILANKISYRQEFKC